MSPYWKPLGEARPDEQIHLKTNPSQTKRAPGSNRTPNVSDTATNRRKLPSSRTTQPKGCDRLFYPSGFTKSAETEDLLKRANRSGNWDMENRNGVEFITKILHFLICSKEKLRTPAAPPRFHHPIFKSET